MHASVVTRVLLVRQEGVFQSTALACRGPGDSGLAVLNPRAVSGEDRLNGAWQETLKSLTNADGAGFADGTATAVASDPRRHSKDSAPGPRQVARRIAPTCRRSEGIDVLDRRWRPAR